MPKVEGDVDDSPRGKEGDGTTSRRVALYGANGEIDEAGERGSGLCPKELASPNWPTSTGKSNRAIRTAECIFRTPYSVLVLDLPVLAFSPSKCATKSRPFSPHFQEKRKKSVMSEEKKDTAATMRACTQMLTQGPETCPARSRKSARKQREGQSTSSIQQPLSSRGRAQLHNPQKH